MEANPGDVPPPLEGQPELPSDPPSGRALAPSKPYSQSAADQRDWKSALFPAEKPSKIFKLRFIPPSPRDDINVGVCPKEAVQGELVLLDLTLVGFFLGKRPAFTFVKSSLLRQWKLRGNVEILQLLHGGYAFRFSDIRDRDSVLDGEAVYIGGQPMFIRQWERSIHTGGILGLRKVPLWITLPGLPLHLWGEEALSAVCSVLGNPLYTDRTTALKSRMVYARVCVEFSGDKPLLETISIEDDMGLMYTQKVGYEWKPPQCLKCGVFGHEGCELKEEVFERPAQVFGQNLKNLSERSTSESANEMELQNNIVEPICLEKEKQAAGDETHVEEGWELVRARKKRPIGSGAPFPSHTRPGSQRHKADGERVSKSYWAKRNLSIEKVHNSALSLNKEAFSNSKSCIGKEGCPLSSFAVLNDGEETPGQKTDSLTTEKSHCVANPYWCDQTILEDQKIQSVASPNGEKNSKFEEVLVKEHTSISSISPSAMKSPSQTYSGLERTPKDPSPPAGTNRTKDGQPKTATCSGPIKPLTSLGLRPASFGSTAGHTPFKSRLATMARELRTRKIGPSGVLENIADIPSTEDEICSNHLHHSPAGPIGMYRVNTNLPKQNCRQDIVDTYGEKGDQLGEDLELPEDDPNRLHMEMPHYLLTRKNIMKQHKLDHVYAREQPMPDIEDQGDGTFNGSGLQEGDEKKESMGHGQAKTPN